MWVLAMLVIYLACVTTIHRKFVPGRTYVRIHAVESATLRHAASLK